MKDNFNGEVAFREEMTQFHKDKIDKVCKMLSDFFGRPVDSFLILATHDSTENTYCISGSSTEGLDKILDAGMQWITGTVEDYQRYQNK